MKERPPDLLSFEELSPHNQDLARANGMARCDGFIVDPWPFDDVCAVIDGEIVRLLPRSEEARDLRYYRSVIIYNSHLYLPDV